MPFRMEFQTSVEALNSAERAVESVKAPFVIVWRPGEEELPYAVMLANKWHNYFGCVEKVVYPPKYVHPEPESGRKW